jgi:hypothetical protein
MTDADPRVGKAESGTVTIASGDGNTPQTVLQIPSNALFQVERLKIEYSASATNDDQDIILFDESDGTSSGNVSDERDSFLGVDNDDSLEFEGPMRIFEEDVLVQCETGNQDGDVVVTVYGHVLTALRDTVAY